MLTWNSTSAPGCDRPKRTGFTGGVGNPEIGFRSLPIAVLMNKYTLTDLLQTCPPMHHTVPSPPAPPTPQLCQNSGISLFVHLRMLTPNLCEISLCKGNLQEGTHRIHVRKECKNKTKRKTNPERSRGAHHLVSMQCCVFIFGVELVIIQVAGGERFSLCMHFL